MALRLKNKELQQNLDKLCVGDSGFSANLAKVGAVGPNGAYLKFGDKDQYRMKLDPDDVEPIPVFNPNGWNVFPDVTPPKDRGFRVEFWSKGEHEVVNRCLLKTYGHMEGVKLAVNCSDDIPENAVIRLRLWEE